MTASAKSHGVRSSREVHDFLKTFQGTWQQYSNVKAPEKLKMTSDMLRTIASKDNQFVKALLQVNADCISLLVGSICSNRKLLGPNLPHDFHRFIVQVKKALGEEKEEEKGKYPRLDRIRMDLDNVKQDVAGEFKARLSLIEVPSELHGLLLSEGDQMTEEIRAGRSSLLNMLLDVAKKVCTTQEDVLGLLHWLRQLCGTAQKKSILQACLSFAEWCAREVPLEDVGRTALQKLQKCVTKAMGRLEEDSASSKPVLDDRQKRKLLGDLYTCTSEAELRKMFPSVRSAISDGQVGDYLERLTVALVRKARSFCAPLSELHTAIYELLAHVFPARHLAPHEEVRSFMGATKRTIKFSGEGKKRGRDVSVDERPAKRQDTGTSELESKEKAKEVKKEVKPHRVRVVKRKEKSKVKSKKKSWAVVRQNKPPMPPSDQIYWAQGSLNLKQLLLWTLRKRFYDEIFDI